MLKFDKKRINITDVYLIVCALNIIAIFSALYLTNGTFLSEIVWDARNDLFVDFNSVIGDHVGSCGYYFFYLIGKIIPVTIADTVIERWFELYYVIMLCISLEIIILLVRDYLKEPKAKIFLFLLGFIVSQPFAFACIKSGNATIFSVSAVTAALFLRKSDKKVLREIALFLIVFSADLKLAPAILGVLYISEKRYKEAIRLAIYGVVFIVGELVVTDGFLMFYAGTSPHAGSPKPRPETIIGVVLEIADVLGLPSNTGMIAGYICAFLYLGIVLALLFWCKSNWKTLFLLVSVLVIFVNMSYPYTLCYLIGPIVVFLNEERDNMNAKNCVYATLLALVFHTYPILRIDWPTATFISNYFFLYILIIIIIADLVISKIRKRPELI